MLHPSLQSINLKSPLSLSKVFSTDRTDIGNLETNCSTIEPKRLAKSQPRIANLLSSDIGPLKMDWMSYRKLQAQDKVETPKSILKNKNAGNIQ